MSAASDVNQRIAAGTAVVRTLEELCQHARNDARPNKADLVALACPTGMSGSAAMFCVQVAGRGDFTRAHEIFMNHLRGYPGPAPNERLGVVDALIFADEQSSDAGARYDGATLFLDMLHGRPVEVECHSVEGTTYHNSFDLQAAEFARFYVYNAALPAGARSIRILRDTLVTGTRVVLNGSQGIIVGSGMRDRPDAMALSITADMQGMDVNLMSSNSGRPHHVVAFALPVDDAATIIDLVGWADSKAGEALLCPSALSAASGLKRMIQEGCFALAETGAVGTTEVGG